MVGAVLHVLYAEKDKTLSVLIRSIYGVNIIFLPISQLNLCPGKLTGCDFEILTIGNNPLRAREGVSVQLCG